MVCKKSVNTGCTNFEVYKFKDTWNLVYCNARGYPRAWLHVLLAQAPARSGPRSDFDVWPSQRICSVRLISAYASIASTRAKPKSVAAFRLAQKICCFFYTNNMASHALAETIVRHFDFFSSLSTYSEQHTNLKIFLSTPALSALSL